MKVLVAAFLFVCLLALGVFSPLPVACGFVELEVSVPGLACLGHSFPPVPLLSPVPAMLASCLFGLFGTGLW